MPKARFHKNPEACTDLTEERGRYRYEQLSRRTRRPVNGKNRKLPPSQLFVPCMCSGIASPNCAGIRCKRQDHLPSNTGTLWRRAWRGNRSPLIRGNRVRDAETHLGAGCSGLRARILSLGDSTVISVSLDFRGHRGFDANLAARTEIHAEYSRPNVILLIPRVIARIPHPGSVD